MYPLEFGENLLKNYKSVIIKIINCGDFFMQNLKRILFFMSCFLLSNQVTSGACDDYDYGHNELTVIEEADEGFKVIATAHEAILFQDESNRILSEEIAEELAYAVFARFWGQDVARACATNRTFETNVKFSSENPETKEATQEQLTNRVCALANNTDAFMRGAKKLDWCTQVSETPRVAKVTVGITSDLIKTAERMVREVGESIAGTSTLQSDNLVMHPECVADPSSEKCEKGDSEEESADSKGMPLNKAKDKKGGEKIKKF